MIHIYVYVCLAMSGPLSRSACQYMHSGGEQAADARTPCMTGRQMP